MSQKSRNFSGCWTCRSRKVKCDLTKPTCQRCQKAGLECSGYEIKLGWSSPLTVSAKDNSLVAIGGEGNEIDSTFQRRNVEFVRFGKELRYETFRQLNDSLEKLEAERIRENRTSWRVGPFSIYKVGGGREKLGGLSKRQYRVEKGLISSRDGRGSNSTGSRERLEFSNIDNSLVHEELLEWAKLTIYSIKGTDYELGEQNMLHILYPKFFPNIDSDDWLVSHESLQKLFYTTSEGFLLTDMFKNLMINFKNVDLSFIRVAYRHNLWESIVLPYVNQIACEFICFQFGSWTTINIKKKRNPSMLDLKNDAKMGIIFLVLSLSAFRISRLQGETDPVEEYCKLSIELRKISIGMLNYHLDEYDNNMGDETYEYEDLVLLWIILQDQIDGYFSVFENLELLYAIGDFILRNKLDNKPDLAVLTKYLVTTFKILQVFFESSHAINHFNYSIEQDDEENYKDLKENYDLVSDNDDDDDNDENDNNEVDDNNNDNDNTNQANGIQKPRANFNIQIKPSNQKNSESPIEFTLTFNGNNPAADNPGENATQPPENGSYVTNIKTSTDDNLDTAYLMCGIPPSLLGLINRTVHLTNHKLLFTIQGVFPRNFPKICADVEDAIMSWNLNDYWHLYDDSSSNNNTTKHNANINFLLPFHEYLYHSSHWFHNGLIVYFFRLIKNAPIPHYTKYCDAAFNHLHQLLALNRRHPKLEIKPSFWVLLVCGSEISNLDYKNQICNFWAAPELSSFNAWRTKQILYEVWKRREDGEECSWMDLVREWDIVLSLG